MACNIYKILLMSSVVVLLFVESSTGKPIQSKTGKKSGSKAPLAMIDKQNHFEGDILLEDSKMIPRAGRLANKMWPDKTIPYTISDKYDQEAIDLILEAMESIQSKTCIKFIERTTEEAYIKIYSGNGCSSYVGNIGIGAQDLSLGQGCLNLAAIKHELMHAIGFYHEQSRTDRDDYVIIHYDNIQAKMKSNFNKYDKNQVKLHTPYDTKSIMHYGPYFFAEDEGKPTISAKNGEEIGGSDDFTESDIEDINLLYKCQDNDLDEYE